MSISGDDVRRIASLARLSISDTRVEQMARELSGILEHVGTLSRVDMTGVEPSLGAAAEMPLRPDHVTASIMSRDVSTIAPAVRDGFFLVPRLASHETPSE